MTCEHCGKDPCVCAADPFAADPFADAGTPAAPAAATRGDRSPAVKTPKPAWRIVIDVLAVLLFVGVVGSGLFNQLRNQEPEEAISALELQKGDCYQTDDQLSFYLVVDCDMPHSGEIYSAITITGAGDQFPGKERIEGALSEPCLDEFAAYSILTFDELDGLGLDVTALQPNEKSWDDGDRTILCMVRSPSHDKLGSIRGSG